MRTQPLGPSGIEASVVGLGAWAIGGWMWGGTNEEDSIATIHAALDAGINLIDTAPIYGFGRSEEVVGRAIRDRRDKVVLATKCGLVCDPGVGERHFNSNCLGPDPIGIITVSKFLAPDSIKAEVEGSLKRLQTDYIDLLQTHWQEKTTPIEDTMGALMGLKKEGKIRAIGVSNATASQMGAYQKIGPLDSDQEKFSMLDRKIERDQLPFCRKHGVAVLGYSPLALGLLTGKIGPERKFNDGDLRLTNKRFSVENRTLVAQMLEAFKPIAEAHNCSLAQLVIAWSVHPGNITHALCGARHPQQARENAAAGDVELSNDEFAAMNKAIDEYAGKIV